MQEQLLSPLSLTSDAKRISEEVSTEVSTEVPESKDAYISFCGVFKRMSKLAIPLGLSFTFSFQVFFVTYLLTLLSETDEENAAATLVSTYMNTFGILALCPVMATTIYLSNQLGQFEAIEDKLKDMQEKNESKEAIDGKKQGLEEKRTTMASASPNSFLMSAVIAATVTPMFYFSRPILVGVFGQEDKVARHAEEFLRLYAFAIPGLMARMASQQVMFAFNKVWEVMTIGVVNLVLGGALSVWLAFEKKQGAKGVAIGFVLETYLTALLSMFFLAKHRLSSLIFCGSNKRIQQFGFYDNFFQNLKSHGDQLKELSKIGTSLFYGYCLELSLTFTLSLVSGDSEEEQSAMAYNMQFIYFEFIMLAAFGYVCLQEISRELGKKNYKAVNSLATHGLYTMFVWLVPVPLVFGASPKLLETISGGATKEVSDILQILVPLMSVGTIVDMGRYTLFNQLRGLDDHLVPNIIATVSTVTGVILAPTLHNAWGYKGLPGAYIVAGWLSVLGLHTRRTLQLEALEKQIPVSQNPTSFFNSQRLEGGVQVVLVANDETDGTTTGFVPLEIAGAAVGGRK